MEKKIKLFFFFIFLVIACSIVGLKILNSDIELGRYFFYLKIFVIFFFIILIQFSIEYKYTRYFIILICITISLMVLQKTSVYLINSVKRIDNLTYSRGKLFENYFLKKTRVVYFKNSSQTHDRDVAIKINLKNSNIIVFRICITGYCSNDYFGAKISNAEKLSKIIGDFIVLEKGLDLDKIPKKFIFDKNNLRELENYLYDHPIYPAEFSYFVMEYMKKLNIKYLMTDSNIVNNKLLKNLLSNAEYIDRELNNKKKKTYRYLYKIKY